MIIQGTIKDGSPCFVVYLHSEHFNEIVWMLADTGANKTTLLDSDLLRLDISEHFMIPLKKPLIGIGGIAQSYKIDNVELGFNSSEGFITIKSSLYAVKHTSKTISNSDKSRMKMFPSLLGRDIINQFTFVYDNQKGIVQLEK